MDTVVGQAEAQLALKQYPRTIQTPGQARVRVENTNIGGYLKHYEARAALNEGEALLALRRGGETLPRLATAVRLALQVNDPELSPALADSMVALGSCKLDLGHAGEARLWLARAKAIHARNKELGPHLREPLRALAARLPGMAAPAPRQST